MPKAVLYKETRPANVPLANIVKVIAMLDEEGLVEAFVAAAGAQAALDLAPVSALLAGPHAVAPGVSSAVPLGAAIDAIRDAASKKAVSPEVRLPVQPEVINALKTLLAERDAKGSVATAVMVRCKSPVPFECPPFPG